jgi:hypothetical protein
MTAGALLDSWGIRHHPDEETGGRAFVCPRCGGAGKLSECLDNSGHLWFECKCTRDTPTGGQRFTQAELAERLRYELARAAEWFTRKKIQGVLCEVPAMPPKDVVADMLANPVAAVQLPPVDRIVRAPVFATDGTLQATPGYHPAGRVIVWPPENLRLPKIPTAPTDRDVERAVALIDDLIGDFPFLNEADRAAAYALLLLPFVRDMIDGPTPLHLLEALPLARARVFSPRWR